MGKRNKKKSHKEVLISALGAGARKAYLEQNKHGRKAGTKVHKSKNNYSRKDKHKKNLKNNRDSSFFIWKSQLLCLPL